MTFIAALFVIFIIVMAFYLNKKLDARAERRRKARENVTGHRQ